MGVPFLLSERFIEFDEKDGVIDGTRTRDNRNHNPGLYQLSYDHHLFGGREG